MKGWRGLMAVTGLAILLTGCGEGSSGGADGTAAAPPHPGEATFNRYCFSCHAAGIASSPKIGDVEAWAPRIAKGEAALLESTINGVLPSMPARGLCTQCTDEELADAIDYMVSRSR